MKDKKTVLVIFGIMGDLSRRKLIPALANIANAGLLNDTAVIGVTRQDITKADIFSNLPGSNVDTSLLEPLLDIFTMDLAHEADYRKLRHHIQEVVGEFGPDTQVVYYLSVPPHATIPIAEFLGKTGLFAHTKLMLEKPFGVDLPSATESIERIGQYFAEDQIYRIDHYLAKEMTQNIVAFRTQNALFRHLWHRDYIEKIEIISAEQIGIEGRANFYEQTGALRDFMQNHMMQLLSLVIMNIPANDQEIPAERLGAVKALLPIKPTDVTRGQYVGYQAEAENPGSPVETFVTMTVFSDDERWRNVPIHLATGKKLERQSTEIRVYFRKSTVTESNRLVLHVQPKQGIEIDLWTKKPGYSKTYEMVDLSYHYPETGPRQIEAYERVLIDAFSSDKSLFTTADEVLRSWQLLEPIQEHWEMHPEELQTYQPGTPIEDLMQ